MSFKAYFMSINTPREIEIVHNYLEKFEDIAFFSYYAVAKKGINKPFKEGHTLAAITIDRADLIEAFCEEEGGVCTVKEMPQFCRLDGMPTYKDNRPKFMDIKEGYFLRNEKN